MIGGWETRSRRSRPLLSRAGGRARRLHRLIAPRAWRGCDYVVNTVQVGGKKATVVDFDIPEEVRGPQTIADTTA